MTLVLILKYFFLMLTLPDDLYIFTVFALAVSPFAVHDRGIHIGRRKGVGLIQQ